MDITICKSCGFKKPGDLADLNGSVTCSNCGDTDWTKAVIEK